MISKDSFPVFAQYNEDIIIASLLPNIENGFYVDVGANDEEYHSVTKYFYQRGWSGINIEPIPRLLKVFEKKRKRDINLNIAVSEKKGTLKFREYPEHDGFSTLSTESKGEESKLNIPYNDYSVKVDSLENIFSENSIKKIDFLKIDVEGYEFEVLKSNNWEKYRPTVVCIEANHRTDDWSSFLEGYKYELVIYDGLNEYYIAKESSKLFEGFAERAAINSHNGIRNHHFTTWSNDIKHLEGLVSDQDRRIQTIQGELDQERRYSLRNKPYLQRIKVAIKGLVADYFIKS
ncbi:MAG: FkbM family methyltransferase [Patescibacteria group bacterium]